MKDLVTLLVHGYTVTLSPPQVDNPFAEHYSVKVENSARGAKECISIQELHSHTAPEIRLEQTITNLLHKFQAAGLID